MAKAKSTKAPPTPAKIASDDNVVKTRIVDGKKTSIVVSKTFESAPRPGQLGIGEVGQYVNSKGKTTFVVGTASGGVSKGIPTILGTAQTVNKIVKSAESQQIKRLDLENKIELSQLQKTLKSQGLSKAEINAAVKAEATANKRELSQAKSIAKTSGYQLLSRDDNGLLVVNTVDRSEGITIPKTFNTTVITNPDGTKTSTLNSLLYSGTGADVAKANGAKYINLVDEFAYSHGLNTNYSTSTSGKTTTSKGINPSTIYDAMMAGFIKARPIEKTAADGTTYTDNDFYIGKSVGDESPLGRKFGEGFTRQVTNLLLRGTEIGDKAFTKEVDGKTYITRLNGKDLSGGEPLKFTGEYDAAGNKIYSQVTNMDTRYQKASTLNVYVKNPDGSFTYMGTPNMAYTQTEKQKGGFSFGNFIKGVALSVGATMLGQTYLAPLIGQAFGLSTGLANAAAAAIAGGGLSAVQGGDLGDVLSSSALAAIGQGVGDIVSKAASQAGGYTALMDDIAKNGISNYVSNAASQLYGGNIASGIKLTTDAAGNIVSAADDALTAGTQVGTGVNLNQFADEASKALATTGSGLLNQTIATTPTNIGGTTAGDILGANMPTTESAINAVDLAPITTAPGIQQGISLQYDANGNIVNPATQKPYTSPGVNMSYDAAGNLIGDTGTGIGTGVNLVNPSTGSLVTPPATTTPVPSTPGLLDSIQKATGLSPWQQAALVGGAGLGVAGYNAIQNMLNQQPVEPNYPSFDLNLPTNNSNMLGMPQWWQDLYSRGGYGAGNYLGYDILKGINIPSDVQSLLGMNSGQNTGSSLIA